MFRATNRSSTGAVIATSGFTYVCGCRQLLWLRGLAQSAMVFTQYQHNILGVKIIKNEIC
jgi:hypothetical protein